jgi:hypothetical protein
MKRTVFLAVALFALMAVGLYAQTEADFDVSKSADGKSITITEYKGKATTVNIPAKIQNLPVTSIGEAAFREKMTITSVVIPNGVTSIGNTAFFRCSNLTNVTIPASVTSIGNGAFDMCNNITSVTIPNSVKSIGNTAFQNCAGLASITIPASVTSIGSGAFRYCNSLISVTFAGSIPSSGFNANAFNGLGDIRDKYLAAGGGAGTYTRPNDDSETWTKGGSTAATPAAAGTPGLEYKLTSDGKGYIVSKGTLRPNSATDLVIPATYNNLPVTQIPSAAFNDCVMLRNLTIPASVTEIGIAAFAGCASLNSVTFGGANTRFGNPEFPEGDLLAKYKAGGAGTYTRNGKVWTKK